MTMVNLRNSKTILIQNTDIYVSLPNKNMDAVIKGL